MKGALKNDMEDGDGGKVANRTGCSEQFAGSFATSTMT
jgi:hypothetical protein